MVDDQLNVYLIDFGMSRLGSEEISLSSVFRGTPGFMPPEQMRKPTEASDLYGLGATLICLLTGTNSTAIQELTDDDDPYKINFRHLLPQLNLHFLNWLELMVQPSLKKRFTNAKTALEALLPLDVIPSSTLPIVVAKHKDSFKNKLLVGAVLVFVGLGGYGSWLKLNSSDAEAYYNRGLAYNQSLKLNPSVAGTYYGRGNAYKNKGSKNLAVKDFKKVLELNNDVELSQFASKELQELGTR